MNSQNVFFAKNFFFFRQENSILKEVSSGLLRLWRWRTHVFPLFCQYARMTVIEPVFKILLLCAEGSAKTFLF